LKVVTPWNVDLRRQWRSDFYQWISDRQFSPVRIEWYACSEDQLASASASAIYGEVDLILGGHFRLHLGLPGGSRLTDRLLPVRTPAVAGMGQEKSLGWQFVNDPNLWPVSGPPLAFQNPLGHELSRAYSLAVWNSNPDQAIGYARWIRLSRGLDSDPNTAGNARLELGPYKKADHAWRGGAGLHVALGLQADEVPHWPEGLTFLDSDASGAVLRDLFRQFCVETKRLAATVSAAVTITSEFATDLAAILLADCRADLQAAWRVIDQSTGEERARTERYLTERPPWPPASVQDLARRRGFEYVVALVEQMAVDGDERYWLIHEFQQPAGLVDLNRLEKAVDGRLKQSIRFRAWLRAEWSTWVRQRCRRVQRFLTEL